MSDLATTSAQTWQDRQVVVDDPTDPRSVPDSLQPPTTGSAGSRLAAWRRRHLLREERARAVFAQSRTGAGGLPVADGRSEVKFISEQFPRRRGLVAILIVVNVLAAIARVIVHRILGDLVDRAVPGADLAALDRIALC